MHNSQEAEHKFIIVLHLPFKFNIFKFKRKPPLSFIGRNFIMEEYKLQYLIQKTIIKVQEPINNNIWIFV